MVVSMERARVFRMFLGSGSSMKPTCLNSLKGVKHRLYRGLLYGVIKGDTRRVDYGSYEAYMHIFPLWFPTPTALEQVARPMHVQRLAAATVTPLLLNLTTS